MSSLVWRLEEGVASRAPRSVDAVPRAVVSCPMRGVIVSEVAFPLVPSAPSNRIKTVNSHNQTKSELTDLRKDRVGGGLQVLDNILYSRIIAFSNLREGGRKSKGTECEETQK